ncbi:hypothetical protein T12_5642 [Trichinella patagoniensis]|uniref:Uncharacterized protein n=1 Tax=Trichinella patagoniensis TaxID=990121 RepID=A0A0V0ZSY1_9BILA|nr:hypothetical protein T12_5642 [Trichinella patagoniensis]
MANHAIQLLKIVFPNDENQQSIKYTKIRNHVDKYVITKHYYQLMPLSLATYCFLDLSVKRQGSYGVKCNCEAPGFTLRLRPRANKNLHMPLGYPPGNL